MAVPIPVQVPIQVPAPQLNVNSVYANNPPANLLSAAYPENQPANLLSAAYPENPSTKINRMNNSTLDTLLSDYRALEIERKGEVQDVSNLKRRVNENPSNTSLVAKVAQVEERVKNITGKIEQLLRTIPQGSIDYKNSSGETFLSTAALYLSAPGVRLLCGMGANSKSINKFRESLETVANKRKRVSSNLTIANNSDFFEAVKQCAAPKGGSRTRKARRKHGHRSRRR